MRKWGWLWCLFVCLLLEAPDSSGQGHCEDVDGQCVCSCPKGTRRSPNACACVAIPSPKPNPDPKRKPTPKPVVKPKPACTAAVAGCHPCQVAYRNGPLCSCRKAGSDTVWGQCLEKKCTSSEPKVCQDLAYYADTQATLKRMRLYDKACDNNVGRACAKLGDLQTDKAQRATSYERACNLGYQPACKNAADLASGTKAKGLNEKACDDGRGDPVACRRYASAIRYSDVAKARRLYAVACERADGDAIACSAYGQMAEQGHGGPRDAGTAYRAYERGCFQPKSWKAYAVWACNDLGRMRRARGQTDGAKAAYERVCSSRFIFKPSCESLGDIYKERGKLAEAEKHYREACDEGKPLGRRDACFKLGLMSDKRTKGNASGLSKALESYRHGCKRRHKEACARKQQLEELLADGDGDEIVNLDDKCRKEAEDKDGFEDDDGCPEADNDGDGFLDGKDGCPDYAETKNGVADEDGCPEGELHVVASCGGELDQGDFDVSINGESAEPNAAGRYILAERGSYAIEVESTWCKAVTRNVTVSPATPRMVERFELPEGGWSGTFTGKGTGQKLHDAWPWQFSVSYTHSFLSADQAFVQTAEDAPRSGLSLSGAQSLNGVVLSGGVVYDHFVALLEAQFAVAGDAPVGGVIPDPADPAEIFAGSEADITQFTFPRFRIGGRIPFGMFSLSAGGSAGLSYWRVNGSAGSVNTTTTIELSPWGELQIKPLCDFGLHAGGGYRFGFAPEAEDVNYGFVNAGVHFQPCDDYDSIFRKDGHPFRADSIAVVASYEHRILPRNLAVGFDDGAYGTTFGGLPTLNGVRIGIQPFGVEYLLAQIDIGVAVSDTLPVQRHVSDPEEFPDAEPLTDVEGSLLAWTFPGIKLGLRVPIRNLALTAGGSADLEWWIPTVDSSERPGAFQLALGGFAGMELRPICDFGMQFLGGYKAGVAGDDGIGYGYVNAGLMYVPSCTPISASQGYR